MSVWQDIAGGFRDVLNHPAFATAMDIGCAAAGGPAAVAACRAARLGASAGLDAATGDPQAARRAEREAERLAREQAWLAEGQRLRDQGTGLTAGRRAPSSYIARTLVRGAWTLYQTATGDWLTAPTGIDLDAAAASGMAYLWDGTTWRQ